MTDFNTNGTQIEGIPKAVERNESYKEEPIVEALSSNVKHKDALEQSFTSAHQ